MTVPYLSLVVVCAVWGTIPLIAREVDLPAAAIVFCRLTLASLGLGVLLGARRHAASVPLLAHRPGRVVLASALLATHWVAMFAAFERAPAGTVLLIVYLAPVLIAGAAPRALGEHHGPRTLAALALAVVGFLLVAGPAADASGGAGVALAAFAAASYAALVLIGKPLAQVYGGVRFAFLEMAGAAVVLAPVAARSGWGPPQPEWWWLVVLGLVHTAAGIGIYYAALTRVPATHVGILGYLEPVTAVLLAWAVLDESPGVTTVAGGALIVVAGGLVILAGRREAAVPVSPEVPGVPR